MHTGTTIGGKFNCQTDCLYSRSGVDLSRLEELLCVANCNDYA
ncbi:MAG: hypothetical protein RPU13_04985 [Candidatus Sedimenticola sp. (ex Thyasira tokunagai)]